MKIRTKRILMLLLLVAGVIWNCLCILKVLPLKLFTVSLVSIGGYSFMIIFIPLFFPGSAKSKEKSLYIHNLTKPAKQMSNATICFAFAWLVTLIICIVYPF